MTQGYYDYMRTTTKLAEAPIPLPAFEAQDQAQVRVRRVVNGYIITPITKKDNGGYSHQADELVATDFADLERKLGTVMQAQAKAIMAHFEPKPAVASIE